MADATNTITVTLTQAELDLIQAQRNKKTAEEKEQLAREEVEKAKLIEVAKKELVSYINEETIHEETIKEFFAKLDERAHGKYKLVTEKQCSKVVASNNRWGDAKVVYAEFPYEYDRSRIELVKTCTGGGLPQIYIAMSRNDRSWRMSIHGLTGDRYTNREYVNVRKVDEKIDEELNARDMAKRNRVALLTAKEQALKVLTERYPTAAVKVETKGYYGAGTGYRRGDWKSYEVIKVMFVNEIVIDFKFSLKSDNTLQLTVDKIHSSDRVKLLDLADALMNVQVKVDNK